MCIYQNMTSKEAQNYPFFYRCTLDFKLKRRNLNFLHMLDFTVLLDIKFQQQFLRSPIRFSASQVKLQRFCEIGSQRHPIESPPQIKRDFKLNNGQINLRNLKNITGTLLNLPPQIRGDKDFKGNKS